MYKKIYRNMCLLSMITLILATIMILSASYTTFNDKLKEEIRSEAVLIADFLNDSKDPVAALGNSAQEADTKRITLISDSGAVIFDNKVSIGALGDHNSRPEVIEAKEKGLGETERYSVSTAQKLYYFAVQLNDGSILRIATSTTNIWYMFWMVLISVLFIGVLIYILSVIVAMRLTDNIVKPLEKIYSFDNENYDNAYEEIQPFLKRIARQNREIQRQMDKVKAQKGRLQAITDNINEGLIIMDKNANVLSVNNCALEIFKVGESYVKHRTFDYLTDKEEIHNALKKALAGEKDSLMVEISNKTYQIFYSPVYEQKNISGVVMLIFDVSDKAKSEQIRREFTANVSHELKTPLTTIHGYAQVIESGIAKPEDIKGFAAKIEKESSRLISLIEDIIKLSNLDENAMACEKQELSLKGVISEVIENLQVKAEEKQINIQVVGNDTKIYANLSQIMELVYNLCDNAIKYNKDGGNLTITLADKMLFVSDTGIGIPEEYIERIYERFFRGDKSHSKKVDGTGLGLSIVKHIAEANDAVIEVDSKVGIGTTFSVKFNR
ncbi:MAG: ATP-binding protein [Bacillota bacterium]|jgi:two-component system phosphate regulon sensor histidine kinase PhoR